MNAFASAVVAVLVLQTEPGAPPPAESARPVEAPAAQAAPSPRPSPPLSGGEGAPVAPARVRVDPAVERGEAERAARAFLGALAANDAAALSRAASERFSFDGETVAGPDAVRSRWRALLSARAAAAPRVGALELWPAADAVTRLGKPPVRLAPLARPGVWVALADVGGRPVVLFLAREGGRMAVLGMHD